MRIRGRIGSRRFLATMCLLCFLLFTAAAEMAEADSTAGISGTFFTFGHSVTREYAYSEAFFRRPSDVYSHDLARLSLGMALAAFRDENHPQEQDFNLIAFLQAMGFDQIETEPYRTAPTSYSIAYGIAQMKMDDRTVIALAVCGGGYGAEWASNLTVGDDVRPVGFQDASQQVQAALRDYLERHPVDGDAVLWTTGYSRGGAVSNITAADCTDSGIFMDLYAYTFATPRTTRNPGHYSNIFNILQKNDIVPKIPLSDWGFERYGTDLFLVSPEIDMDCEAVAEQAAALYREIVDAEMVRNYEINYQLRILLDYLYMLVQDSASYTMYLQPLVLDIMTQDEGTQDALQVLLEALQRYSLQNDHHGEELKAMRDYVGILINVYYLQDGIGRLPVNQWDPQFGTANLFNEHLPFEYLAMMFASDDPQELFSENTKYVRLVIYGNVDAQILDGDRILKTILADGRELVDGAEAPDSLPDVDCANEKIVITLPANRSYTVSIKSRSALPQTVTYTGLLFSGNTVRAEADDLYSYLMNSGDTAIITTSIHGKAIEPAGSDHTDVSLYINTIYSPTTAMRLENNSVLHLTISGLVNKILFIAVLLLAQMILSIVLSVIRRKTHRKKNVVVAFIWHSVIAAVFAILELALWYFIPILPLAKLIPGILVFIVIVVYALKGYRMKRKGLIAFFILAGTLAGYDILESLLIGDFAVWKGAIMLMVYAGFMIAAYYVLWRKRVVPGENSGETADSAGV